MLQNAANALAHSAPDWVQITSADSLDMHLTATPRGPSGQPGPTYGLRVALGPPLRVFEDKNSKVANLLPDFCPERHINAGDGSFCLGLDTFTISTAHHFWAALRSFILCQTYAGRHGLWPPGRWLSHGPIAAQAQLRAEAAAERAGLSERYRRALEFKVGCLAGPLVMPFKRSRSNAEVTPRRVAIEELIAEEIKRRDGEDDFSRDVTNWGYTCCETMKFCPLRNLHNSNALSEKEHT